MTGNAAAVVAKWQAMSAAVQAIGVPPPPPVLAVGARCTATASAKVRATADASAPGLPGSPQPVGALGTVIAPGLVNGYWRVDFDTGPDGYVWAANIVAV